MTGTERKMNAPGGRVGRLLRIVARALGLVSLALLIDQVAWILPMAGYLLATPRFELRCRAVRVGMDRSTVIDMMNGVASQQYSDDHQLEFDRLLPDGGKACTVELDDAGKVRQVAIGHIDPWVE
jgi:hypothetical protein